MKHIDRVEWWVGYSRGEAGDALLQQGCARVLASARGIDSDSDLHQWNGTEAGFVTARQVDTL